MNKQHKKRNTLKGNVLWGSVLGLIFTGILQAYFWTNEPPVPYTDVTVLAMTPAPKGYQIEVLFVKNTCTFKRLEVFGNNTGVLQYLTWFAQDGSPSKDYDRSKGQQYMNIVAETEHDAYDAIEIRTRHECAGVVVDKLFARIDINKADK